MSRPQTVKVVKAQPGSTKAKATTVSGAVSSYDEMLDDDTEVEADDPGPESTLEGDCLLLIVACCGKCPCPFKSTRHEALMARPS